MPKISVIVPVYNTEKYISRCIESILSQTLEDIEIIIVDDGSTDNSGAICDKFALHDKRVHVIHQKNLGVSIARNIGIEQSSSEWVGFVDSDDWIDTDTYETAYKTATENDASMVVWGFSLNDGNSDYEHYSSDDREFNISDIANLNSFLMDIIFQKLIKKDLLLKYNIKFSENRKITEDTLFSFLCFFYISRENKIYFISKCFYHYFQNPTSAIHTIDEQKRLDSVETMKDMEKIIEPLAAEEKILWQKFIDPRKELIKQNYILEVTPPDCDKWRKTFPELNKKFYTTIRPFVIVYWAIFLHLDFIVPPLISLQKQLHRK